MFASTLARVEHIADINVTGTNQAFTLPTQGGLIPNDRFLWGLRLWFEGRFTNPAAPNNPTGQEADAPFSILESVLVEGYHRLRANREQFVNLRAADLREMVRIYTIHEPWCDVGGTQTRTLNLGDGATSDVRFVIDVPFVPLAMPWRAQYNWLLDAPNYEQLQLTVNVGDWLSVFIGGNAGTLAAYGGGGNPRIIVDGLFAQAGPTKFAGFVPGRVFRHFREITGSLLTTTATAQRLVDFPKGHLIRHVMVKTGVKSTGITAGNNAYATLSDIILTNPRVYRGLNKVNRMYRTYADAKEDICGIGGFADRLPNAGYAFIDWAARGFDNEVLDTRNLVAGPSGDVDLFFQADVTGAANQAALFGYEEWRYSAQTIVPRNATVRQPAQLIRRP